MPNRLITTRKVPTDANGIGRDNYGGQVLMFDSSLTSVTFDLIWIDGNGNDAGTVRNVLFGRIIHAGGDFSGYRIENADPNDEITVQVGPEGAFIQDAAGAITIGHVVVDNEVEVKNDAGNPLNIAQSEAGLPRGVTVTDATNAGLVAVNDVGVAAIAADATRKSVRFRNTGNNPVALLAAAANVFANAAVVIDPGQTWNETEAPGAAWYAKCGAGLASTLAVQSVKP